MTIKQTVPIVVLLLVSCLLLTTVTHGKVVPNVNYTLPVYDNCVLIGKDNDIFQWTIKDNMFYGRAIGKTAESGWTAIGFSSGYEYDNPPVEDDAAPISKMKLATIYMGYKDYYRNIHINEYMSLNYQQPNTIPEQKNKLTFSLGRAGPNDDSDFHLIFERPLTTSDNFPNYYQFVPGDKSNLLFAKHPINTPNNPTDFEQHSVAKLRKIDFFGSYKECGSVSTKLLALPSYLPVLEEVEEEERIRGSGWQALPSVTLLAVAFILSVVTTLVFT